MLKDFKLSPQVQFSYPTLIDLLPNTTYRLGRNMASISNAMVSTGGGQSPQWWCYRHADCYRLVPLIFFVTQGLTAHTWEKPCLH